MKAIKSSAAIIGSGVAGLATSIRLAAKGMSVHVFEKNSYPGGKLSEIRVGKYRFDAGPSLFTMPQYLEDTFRSAGLNLSDYFSYTRHPTACHYFWDDGIFLPANGNLSSFAEKVEEVLGVPKSRILKYMQNARFTYEKTGRIFLEKSLHKWSTWLSHDTLKAIAFFPRYQITSTLHDVNEKWLEHPKLVQLFDRFATYNGSDPYQTPGIMHIIPHFEHNVGTFFPVGGMHAITKALYNAAIDLGVHFHFDSKVERIHLTSDYATGLDVNGEFIPFDLVVSNMDVVPTYRHLIPDAPQPQKILDYPRSSSALIFYWGIKHQFPELDMHNIFFSNDYKEEFNCIFNKKTVYDDPTVYINITSRWNPEDAPEGADNWFVMVNVPGNTGQDWDDLLKKTRNNVLKKLSKRLDADISALIEAEATLDPRSIESKTYSYQGSLYGAGSNDIFSAFARHPNFHKKIRNLYFCGGSVHPGGGIPLCLLSARIVSDLIDTHS
ncbi:MAG: 1-hydroxycarotenoid 3,4-desaturase CrtD [Thermaurantimonas sp.]